MEILTEEDEGFHKDLIEWYYLGGIFDENSGKFSNWLFITTYLIARGSREFNSMWLFPPEDKEQVYDIGYMNLKPRSVKGSRKRVDVGYKNNFIQGYYPNYHFYFESLEPKHILNIKFEADTEPRWITKKNEQDKKVIRGIKNSYLHHYFIPRVLLEGTITVKNKSYNVQGDGYWEHSRGFIDPLEIRGWIWIGIPRAEGKGKGLCINIASTFNLDGTPQNQVLYFTENGKDYGNIYKYDFKIIETEKFVEDISYWTKIQLIGKEGNDKIELTFVRSPNTYKIDAAREGSTMKGRFITGPCKCTGTLEWEDRKYKIRSIAIGSSMFLV
ncbi:MAG: hypothetical protein ACTSO9_11255 [Candidatus Helarchaeota archaeon]